MSPKGSVVPPYNGPWTHFSDKTNNYQPLCGHKRTWLDGTSRDKVDRNPNNVSCPDCLYILREIKRMEERGE